MIPAPCDPVVTPYRDVTDTWIVRCTCGRRDIEWATEDEATEDRDQHAAGAP